MARLAPLLGPLATLIWRELGQTASIAGNHLILFTLLLFAMSPGSVVFLLMVTGLVLLFPLSSDPLRRVPQERISLLPLTPAEQVRLRVLSLFLSPVIWAVSALSMWGGRRYLGLSITLLLLATAANAASLLWSRNIGQIQRFSLMRYVPAFPGPLGGLIRKNLREMFHTLDPYAGLVLALTAAVYRFTSPRPVPEAMYGMTLLVALSFSTYAQRLFAMDADHGFERYGLMPIRGWQVLFAKDFAFLLVLMALVLPLAPLPGLAAGLVLLALGHRQSVLAPQSQPRWCFVTGAPGGAGLLQIIAMFVAATATFQSTSLVLIPCATLYLASLFFYGRQFERR